MVLSGHGGFHGGHHAANGWRVHGNCEARDRFAHSAPFRGFKLSNGRKKAHKAQKNRSS
jgi:hypothetical protein